MGAFIFVPALVACVLAAFLFAIFAANHYLNVLQSTGSGARNVDWPSEPLVDNFWKVFYLGWLIGLWLGPAWFIGQTFARSDVPWMRYALPMSVFWLCYPLSQLSSLSGPTIWLPLHHDVFGRLARKPGPIFGFLALSGVTLAAFGLGFYLVFSAPGFALLLIGSPLFVVAGLVYARLLGRLAFALMFTRSILSRKKKKKRKQAKPAEQPEEDAEPEFRQPSELPPIQTPDEGDLAGYDVKFEDAPRKRVKAQAVSASAARPEPEPRKKRPADDDDLEAYGVRDSEVAPEDRAPVDIVKPCAMEMKLLNRDDAPKPPKQVWTLQLFAFLLQPATLAAIVLQTALCIVLGALVRVAREFDPTRGGF